MSTPVAPSAAAQLAPHEVDRSDRRFSPAEFASIVTMLGKSFDLDAASNSDGSNALVPTFCSATDSFLSHDCAGQHIWCNAPFRSYLQFLLHYFSCKSRSPDSTSAVFVVPKWTSAPWWPLVRHMQVLKEYGTGCFLFDSPRLDGTRISMPGIPWPVLVLYDPPQHRADFGKVWRSLTLTAPIPSIPVLTSPATPVDVAPQGAAAAARLLSFTAPGKRPRLSVTLRGKLAGQSCNILFDTGADHSFVDSALVSRAGFHSKSANIQVDLGDGSTAACTSVLGKVQLHVSSLIARHDFLVLPMQHQHFDVILGTDFMDAYSCILDFGSQRITCRKGHRRHTLSQRVVRFAPVGRKSSDADPSAPVLLSAMQVKRILRKPSSKAWLTFVREVPPGSLSVGGVPACESQLQDLLAEFSGTFNDLDMPDGPGNPGPDHGCHSVVPLQEGAIPPSLHQYRLSQAQLKELESQVKALLAKGWIRPSSSPFGAPVVFAPKPDGTWRMCVDYRALNKLTVKNRWPLPRIDDMLDKLSTAKCFSSLDLTHGYHQIRLSPEDIPKTAFRTHLGLYEYTVIPMGLTNAPATFQRVMNETFADEIDAGFVVVYLDDILVFSQSPEDHMKHLRAVLQKLQDTRFYAKRKKCRFFQTELKYLGFIVGNGQLRPDPSKIQSVVDWPVPTTKDEVRSFLGLTNYFRRFVQGYSGLVRPLTDLLKDASPRILEWTDECNSAFEHLRWCLTHAPVLQLPRFDKPFEVVADASQFALGAVLLQDGHPVCFESRKLIPAERNYTTGEQELLAVVHALKKFRVYLLGTQFTLVTDHRPNISINSQVDISSWSGRKARWAEFLQQYTFDFVHREGRCNVADPLSRRPDLRAILCALTRRSVRMQADAITESQDADPVVATPAPVQSIPRAADSSVEPLPIQEVTHAVPALDGGAEFARELAAGYLADPSFLSSIEGKGCTQLANGFWYKGDMLVIPSCPVLKGKLLKHLHDSPYAGHVSERRTLYNVARAKLWWPRMYTEVTQYVKTCTACQRSKALNRKNSGLLIPLPTPESMWTLVSMDFITDLPLTKNGFDSIMVVVDKFSKMCRCIPTVKTVTAEDCAYLFFDNIVKHEGFPVGIVSDRDTKFASKFWSRLFSLHGVDLRMSSAFHPETDGQTERENRTLEDMLRNNVDPTLTDWDLWLPCAEMAINNSFVEAIGTTPFYLNKGRHPRMPLDLAIQQHLPHLAPTGSTVPAAAKFAQNVQDRIHRARSLLLAARDRMRTVANRRRKPVAFAVGQEVLLSTRNLTFKGPNCRKLLPRWIGPFKVLQLCGLAACKLGLLPTMHIHPVFHVSLLRPYRADGRVQPPPPVLTLEGEEEYEVERILDHITDKRNHTKFLVKWLGYGPEHNSWEPSSGLENCPDIVQAYWDYVGTSPSARKRPRRQ
jgi:hypothetical protein